MAQVFRLANKTQTSTYNFLTGNLKPQDMTRVPNGDGWLTTTMTMVARTTDANIISAANSIDELGYYVDLFWEEPHRANSIWLEESATDETTKRSLVQSIEITPLQVGNMGPLLGKVGSLYTLVIIHSAVWENTGTASTGVSTISVLGGPMSLPAIDGSMAARLSLSQIGYITNSTANKMWIGIKSTGYGTTDFTSRWECEWGTLGAGAALASDSDNASPLGTTDNLVNLACSTDEGLVCSLTLAQIASATGISTTDDYIGDYQILLRARLSTADTVRLQIKYGLSGSANLLVGPYIYASSTDYHIYEMGVISIPPYSRPLTSILLDNFQILLYVKNLGAANTLSADCFVPIPSRHYMKVSNCTMGGSSIVHSYVSEDDTLSAFTYNDGTGTFDLDTTVGINNWVYPIEGGMLVFASEDSTGSSLLANENQVGVSLTYVERFRTYGE
jgi:hypothetical protein